MTRRTSSASILVAFVLVGLIALPATAKRPSDLASLELGLEAAEASYTTGAARYSSETGLALHLGNLRYSVSADAPEAMGRQALAAFAPQLGLQAPIGADLRLHAVRESLSGTTVRFRQFIGDLPVFKSEVAVTYNRDGEVRTLASTYRPEAHAALAPIQVSAEAAITRLLAHLGLAANSAVTTRHDLVIYASPRGSRLARRITTAGASAADGWEGLVDAATGELFRVDDTKHFVDGTGDVFLPDPLSSALADYGDPGFVDGGDADTAQLTGEIGTRTLRDITNNAGTFSLTGPWAEVIDHDNPFKGLFSQNNSNWNFTRSPDAFEAANGYYHIDTVMRYLNVTLGLDIRPFQYTGGVQFDPSGWGGADNSSYSPGTGRLSFGEGGVDDAEDADVLIHELGHGLHDWVTSGGLSQNQGLSEGVGDYAAVSYSRSFNQWAPGDPGYNWVFSWDGHNPFWNGRVTNYNDNNTYPDDLGRGIHADGQFWASCNVDILELIGDQKTDTAHWEGLGRTGSGSNQQDTAQAVLDAAADMGYSSADLTTMFNVYDGCGYSVMSPGLAIFADGFESGNIGSWGGTGN